MKTGFWNVILMLALIIGALSAPVLASPVVPPSLEPAGYAQEPTIKVNSVSASQPKQDPFDTPYSFSLTLQ